MAGIAPSTSLALPLYVIIFLTNLKKKKNPNNISWKKKIERKLYPYCPKNIVRANCTLCSNCIGGGQAQYLVSYVPTA